MSDGKKENSAHGHDIDPGDHHYALDYIKTRMNRKQVDEMVRRAKDGHGSDFMVTHNGNHSNYKLEYHGGKLKIHDTHITTNE